MEKGLRGMIENDKNRYCRNWRDCSRGFFNILLPNGFKNDT